MKSCVVMRASLNQSRCSADDEEENITYSQIKYAIAYMKSN